MLGRTYIAIDLKSFYASVECVERNLDPLNTNLLVADVSRTDKTICLAVSPSLKEIGVPGRPRLFEAKQAIGQANNKRRANTKYHRFTGRSVFSDELKANPEMEIDYLTAIPRMAKYIEYSTRIYQIYLNYISAEDIHVYSIDEVFIDATKYLPMYKMTAHELAMTMVRDVLAQTGITATAGIGTNMYLCKIAMDIVAKKMPPDKDGVRVAELNEISYREKLWSHTPLTSFWSIGNGKAARLEALGIHTMGELAIFTLMPGGVDVLYKVFGVNAELLIDHAWGYEPCTIDEIKHYKPNSKSLSSGQVLPTPYDYEKSRLVISEMADLLILDVVNKKLCLKQIVIDIGYDASNLSDSKIKLLYHGPVSMDWYGRPVPKHAHGTIRLDHYTSSSKFILETVKELFDKTVDHNLLTRRITICFTDFLTEDLAEKANKPEVEDNEQLDFFTDYEEAARQAEQLQEEQLAEIKERRVQNAIIQIKKKFGKNAVLKAMNLTEGATSIQRNMQIGGHRS
ncbi:DNA methylase [Ruminococcus sp.]|uniref:Y-family DNA polymerase n=1 Tax=Ruminococcus sp. TaxID=41978 RepID=UPI00338DFE95